MKKALSLTVALLLVSLMVKAQNHRWEFGSLLGISTYKGDLIQNAYYDFREANLGFGLFMRNNIHPNLSFRANLLNGQLTGDDANYSDTAERGFTFSSAITEGSLQFELDIFGHRRYQDGVGFNKVISPYLFGGFGFAFLNPIIDYNEARNRPLKSQIDSDKNAVFNSSRFTIPLGIGIKADVSEKWTVGIEWGARTVFSDLLDGVSQSGDPSNEDWYTFGGLTVAYRFGELDTDKDGVVDTKDDCPYVSGVKALSGCPDIDQDGVTDAKDECPYEKGYTGLNGCPDRDKDGISDKDDNCPNDPGTAELMGCPMQDRDGDGVQDLEDNCPDEIGLPERQGCPFSDRDKDGLEDFEDHCPDEAGFSFNNGCPDTDNDKIVDKDDLCPEYPGTLENNGCPEITEKEAEILKSAAQSIFFEHKLAKIQQESYTVLDEVVRILQRYQHYHLKLDGYTDNQGNDYSNQLLSEDRARACYNYLVEHGINPKRMSYEGFGENNPIANNGTLRGRALNRRVEFTLYKPE